MALNHVRHQVRPAIVERGCFGQNVVVSLVSRRFGQYVAQDGMNWHHHGIPFVFGLGLAVLGAMPAPATAAPDAGPPAVSGGPARVWVLRPLDGPNGVGLSPDGKRVYAAETYTGRVFAWELSGPGALAAPPPPVGNGGELVCARSLTFEQPRKRGRLCVSAVRGVMVIVSYPFISLDRSLA